MPCCWKEIRNCSKLKTEKVEQRAEGANEARQSRRKVFAQARITGPGHGWGGGDEPANVEPDYRDLPQWQSPPRQGEMDANASRR